MATFSSAIHSKPPRRTQPYHSSFIIYSYISITNMTDKDKYTSSPSTPTQPPWLLTPPRSAERLMRTLSIDPCGSSGPIATSHDNRSERTYLAYLERIKSPSYQDPPLPCAPPKAEPLFLTDDIEDDDDIQIGTDNRMVSTLSATLTCRFSSAPQTPLLLTPTSPSALTRMTISNSPARSSHRTALRVSVHR